MSASIETQLKKSQKALSSQKFAEARDGFRQVLERFPGNARAKRGFWISQSALADSGFVANHPPRQQLDDITTALRGGRAEEVAAMASALVTSFPRAHGLHNLLGVAEAKLGHKSRAIAAFRAAVELKPDFLEARANLASLMLAQGGFDTALPVLSDSLEMAPEDGTNLIVMTVCLIGMKRYDDALAMARRAIKVRPDQAETHNNLGLCLRHLDRLDEAIQSFRRALEITPDFIDAILNLGVALVRAGQAETAITTYRRELEAGRASAKLHNNLGLALIETRQLDDAIAQFDTALCLDPDHLDSRFHRFIAMALSGQLDEAWQHAECRFDSRRAVPVDHRYDGPVPAWDGTASLAGKTLLVHAEQGLGDTLMFLRYLPRLPADTGHVRLAVQGQLQQLIAAQSGTIEVVSLDDVSEDGAAADFQCPIMSLPHRLGGRAAAPAAIHSYLTVPEASLSAWQDRLGATARQRVGFVFRGNPDHLNDKNRSLALARFLTALPAGPDYHFLGIDLRQDERTLLARRNDVHSHCGDLADFRDTAALVSQMDRVVCVDTSVAHLAGALGIETHILLAFTPDWRWGLDGSDSIWYPSVTLHRQPAHGDWQPVLDAIHTMLAQPEG